MQHIRSQNVRAGVVINPGTPVSFIEPVLSSVDMVLVMTVNPGFGGQAFIPETLKKIEELNQYRQDHNLEFLIQVDGGINDETIQLCHKAGTDVFVAGSNIFGAPSPTAQIAKLKQLVN